MNVMPDLQTLWEYADDLARRFADARVDQAQAVVALSFAEQQLRLIQAQAEIRAIEAAGGDEKTLGPNAEARQRNLLVRISEDPEYQSALAAYREALAKARLAEAEADVYREQLRLITAALSTMR